MTLSGPKVTHAYSVAGTFFVSLTVADATGHCSTIAKASLKIPKVH